MVQRLSADAVLAGVCRSCCRTGSYPGSPPRTLNISMKTPEFKAFIRSSYEVIENDSGVLKFFLHSDPKTKIYRSSFTM
jgi:hypothetical protein